jgi:hypothetical protein
MRMKASAGRGPETTVDVINQRYSDINQNIGRIMQRVEQQFDIPRYLILLTRLPVVDVRRDSRFQRDYISCWKLNAARLSGDFRIAYFRLMQELRGQDKVDIEAVTRSLFQVPTHKSGRRSIQFSFSSKLVHTLDPHRPIYDVMVRRFFSLPEPGPTKTFEARLQLLLKSYRFLRNEHKRILGQNLLQASIDPFRDIFRLPEIYTDEKIIDTLIWRYMDLRTRDR